MSYWIGLVLKIIIVLFLLFDAGIKIIKHPQALDGSEKMGFSASSTQLLGFVLLFLTVIYLIPQTTIFGLILLTAYLGGANGRYAYCENARSSVCLSNNYRHSVMGFTSAYRFGFKIFST